MNYKKRLLHGSRFFLIQKFSNTRING